MKIQVSLVAVAMAGAMALAGCSSTGESASTTAADSTTAATSTAVKASDEKSADALSFEEAFVKAKPEGKDMTGIFGHLVNSSDKDIHIVKVSGSVDAKMWQLHEMQGTTMVEMEDGFVVPAGGSYELKPGGSHATIMGYSPEIAAGDTLDVTFEDADGNSYEFKDIPVRDIQSGIENYGPDGQAQVDNGMEDMHMNHEGGDTGHGEHMEHGDHADSAK